MPFRKPNVFIVTTIMVCILNNAFAQVLRNDTVKRKSTILTIEGPGNTPYAAAIPDSKGFINDFEGVFNQQQKDSLNRLFRKYELYSDSNQFTIVTLEKYDPYSKIDEAGMAIADVWQLGFKNKNGVMLIFSRNLRQARIQVGEGLADKLDETGTKFISDNYLIPDFRAGNYGRGAYRAMESVFMTLFGKK